MDYEKIGMRIRLFRLKKGLSQEQLAELADISVTHMSHIETGNTKLSLPVFFAISQVLNVRTDELLSDPNPDHESVLKELAAVLNTCTPQQARCIVDIIKATKESLDNYFTNKQSQD